MSSGPDVATRKASKGSPILSLVDREYLKSTANISRQAWEPIAYCYSEADQSIHRVQARPTPGCKGIRDACKPPQAEGLLEHVSRVSSKKHDDQCREWVRASCLKDWAQVLGWLDEILLESQSIEALRSWQMMTGLQAQNGLTQRPSAAIMPDFPQPTPPGQSKPKRSMLRGDV